MNEKQKAMLESFSRDFNISLNYIYKYFTIKNSVVYTYRICKALYEASDNHIMMDHEGIGM